MNATAWTVDVDPGADVHFGNLTAGRTIVNEERKNNEVNTKSDGCFFLVVTHLPPAMAALEETPFQWN